MEEQDESDLSMTSSSVKVEKWPPPLSAAVGDVLIVSCPGDKDELELPPPQILVNNLLTLAMGLVFFPDGEDGSLLILGKEFDPGDWGGRLNETGGLTPRGESFPLELTLGSCGEEAIRLLMDAETVSESLLN